MQTMIKNPKTETRKLCKTIVSHDSSSFNYLNPRSGGNFFYREGLITGYNSPFPSSKNPRFKNEAESKVKRAKNCCRTSAKAMLRVSLPTNQTCLVANKIQCCKLRKYWLLIGWNYARVTPYTGVTSLAAKQVCLGSVIKTRNIDRF